MWLFLIVLVVVLGFIIASRIFYDIRRQELTHVRLMQSDQHGYDKYVRITRQEALEDVKRVIMESQRQLPEARTYDEARDALPEAQPYPDMIKFGSAWVDPRLTSEDDIDRMRIEQARRARKRT